MLPESPHFKTLFTQLLLVGSIPFHVSADLWAPILPTTIGDPTMERAVVKKAPISEDRQAERRHYNVGLPRQIVRIAINPPPVP